MHSQMLTHLGHGRSSNAVGQRGTGLVTQKEMRCPEGLLLLSGFVDLGQNV